MDWNDLRYFLTLARLGSVRAAGAELGVSHSTVARRVEALEEEIGARLFDRHRDGYALNDSGRRMLARAERVEDEVCALTRDVAGRDQRLSGRVHLTCSDEYVAALLLHHLRPWCEAHPDVDLAVTTDARPFNLAKGEADLAVRALGRDASPPEYLVARRVAPIVIVNYVARAHAERLDPARGAARWLAFDDRRVMDTLIRGGSYPDLPTWGSFSSLRLMAQAIAAGLGLGMLPSYAGEAEPALARLDAADPRHVGDLWLLHHPDLRDNARVQAVRAAILDGFARRSALFQGWSTDGPLGPGHAP